MITVSLLSVSIITMSEQRSQNKMRSDEALFSERHFIEVTLAFANNVFASSVKGAESIFWNSLGFEFDVVGPIDAWGRNIRTWQRRIRYLLRDIAEDPSLSPELEKKINRQVLNRVQARPQLHDGHMTMSYQTTDVVQAARLGVALLFHTGLATRLRECERKGCGKFFLAEGKRSRTKYCPGKCAKDEQREKNATRQAKFQAEQKKRRK